jgi:hypothetical protein
MKGEIMIDTSKIIHVSEWRKVSELPSTPNRQTALDEQYSKYGVYQVAEEADLELIGDELVSPHIGYTGKSVNIHDRTYHIRMTANSRTATSHGAGIFIRKNLDINNCYVRYLYCLPGDEISIEQDIQGQAFKNYGYTFKWREASGGVDGNYTNATVLVEKLTNEERKNLILYMNELIKEDLLAEFMSR